jgi:hypothetical protein
VLDNNIEMIDKLQFNIQANHPIADTPIRKVAFLHCCTCLGVKHKSNKLKLALKDSLGDCELQQI